MANTYPIMEVFPTLQGEGKFTGYPAYFIRLAGCDVGCSWCDVKESWPADEYPLLSACEIAIGATESGHKLAVITGGEPCMYDLTALTTELKKRGFQVHLETSGTHQIRGEFDWITLSPKKLGSEGPEGPVIGMQEAEKVQLYTLEEKLRLNEGDYLAKLHDNSLLSNLLEAFAVLERRFNLWDRDEAGMLLFTAVPLSSHVLCFIPC